MPWQTVQIVAAAAGVVNNPSGWRSHRRHLLGVLSLLCNGDTFSDKAREPATPIA